MCIEIAYLSWTFGQCLANVKWNQINNCTACPLHQRRSKDGSGQWSNICQQTFGSGQVIERYLAWPETQTHIGKASYYNGRKKRKIMKKSRSRSWRRSCQVKWSEANCRPVPTNLATCNVGNWVWMGNVSKAFSDVCQTKRCRFQLSLLLQTLATKVAGKWIRYIIMTSSRAWWRLAKSINYI